MEKSIGDIVKVKVAKEAFSTARILSKVNKGAKVQLLDNVPPYKSGIVEVSEIYIS